MLVTHNSGSLFPLTPNFDDIFEDFSEKIYKSDSGSYPRSNIYADGDNTAYITVACTGIPEDKLNVFIDDDDYLVVQAEVEKDTRDYITKQYPVKSFSKKFWIDKKMDIGTVIYENGELIIRLNRKEPRKREIPIISSKLEDAA